MPHTVKLIVVLPEIAPREGHAIAQSVASRSATTTNSDARGVRSRKENAGVRSGRSDAERAERGSDLGVQGSSPDALRLSGSSINSYLRVSPLTPPLRVLCSV